MIIEFEPYRIFLSYPARWRVFYKLDKEPVFKEIHVTYHQLKLLIEQYGYESDDILELKNFGIDTKNIEHNRNLKLK